jgi:DNA topoisomerase-6 subunit A
MEDIGMSDDGKGVDNKPSGHGREGVIRQLEELGRGVEESLLSGDEPRLMVASRSLGNVEYDDRKGLLELGGGERQRSYLHTGRSRKFMQTLLVAAQIKRLLSHGEPALDIRQLYYTLKHTIPDTGENTFDSQADSDKIIEDLEIMLGVLRERMGLVATPNGVLAGPMEVRDATGDILNFARMGSAGGSIPPSVEEERFEILDCSADYVLVVEKYAVWNLLHQQRFWERENCLLLTGKGQPARAERRLVKRLNDELGLPVYVFCDLDPWGYYIHSVYRQGSINLAFFSEWGGCPGARFIGLRVGDVEEFNIPRNSWISLSEGDCRRLEELRAYPWFKSRGWQDELDGMVEFGFKVEQDALVALSIDFTANEYLPTKLSGEDFL